jgi:hypothetical protein
MKAIPMRKLQVHLHVSETEKAKARELADHRGVSVSDALRIALHEAHQRIASSSTEKPEAVTAA